MDAVQSIPAAPDFSATTSPQPKPATSAVGETENRFLKLLVAQLKNQDPLNPLDNAQVTTQLAQLSTVSGIEKINLALQGLATSFASSQSLQATALLGHSVLVPGSGIVLKAGRAVGGVELAQPADSVVISVLDAAGNVLQQVDIGARAAGVAAFQWDGSTGDGTAPDGVYTFSVGATRGNTKVEARPLAFGQVTAVAPGADGALLTVGSRGDVALSEVRQVLPQ